MTVTLASVLESVSKIRIWSGTDVTSTIVADVGMEPLQGAFGQFGIERPRRDMMRGEIIE